MRRSEPYRRRYADILTVHGSGVLYAKHTSEPEALLAILRQSCADGLGPVGVWHESWCPVWHDEPCKCEARLARLESVDGIL